MSLFIIGVTAQDQIIDSPVDHDLFLTGSEAAIDAPVKGDIFGGSRIFED